MKDLKLLSEKLDLDHVDFRVGQVIKSKKNQKVYAILLAYKDARVDMKVLDDVVGIGGWQNEYKRDTKGVLQCGISIKVEDEWITKWSNGVESNSASEKGEYSDAFKRAGFMWGIGRDLYDYPTLFIELNQGEYYGDGDKPKASLKPNDFTWIRVDDKLQAIDKNQKVRFKEK